MLSDKNNDMIFAFFILLVPPYDMYLPVTVEKIMVQGHLMPILIKLFRNAQVVR